MVDLAFLGIDEFHRKVISAIALEVPISNVIIRFYENGYGYIVVVLNNIEVQMDCYTDMVEYRVRVTNPDSRNCGNIIDWDLLVKQHKEDLQVFVNTVKHYETNEYPNGPTYERQLEIIRQWKQARIESLREH